MYSKTDYRTLLSRGFIWLADKPASWPPFEILDDAGFLFYVGKTMDEVVSAKRNHDASRVVAGLSIGGSDMTGEEYYFYGPTLCPADDDPYGELHGMYAIMADKTLFPGAGK